MSLGLLPEIRKKQNTKHKCSTRDLMEERRLRAHAICLGGQARRGGRGARLNVSELLARHQRSHLQPRLTTSLPSSSSSTPRLPVKLLMPKKRFTPQYSKPQSTVHPSLQSPATASSTSSTNSSSTPPQLSHPPPYSSHSFPSSFNTQH